MFAQGRDGEWCDELLSAFGEDAADRASGFFQQADEFERFVGGDAA